MNGKFDVLVKLALVFFISLLSFSIGTFVGKKYSDNLHKTALLEPEKKSEHSADREVASEGEKEHGAKTQQNLSDEEIAKLTEEFVADDAKPAVAGEEEHGTEKVAEESHKKDSHEKADAKEETHGETKHAATEKESAKETHATVAKKEDNKEEHKKEVTTEKAKSSKVAAHEEKEETRKPSSIPQDLSQYAVGKYTVQIASYGSENEAKEKTTSLKEQGYSAYFFPATIKGKTWYRVSVGLFATEAEAKKYKADFTTKTNINSAYIQKISQ